jgi:ATP-dependent RNA helicase DDX24/MAK5
VRVPAEDKDLALYHYLVTHAGRTLVFVNSIKVARRVDALLRELGVNSRVIHAQMQQRQRLRALDAFKAAPIGVLVATDVAARGLDVQRVQHVIHFDIARSPQTYVHRSGRTARASNVGVALSIVSPMDADSHSAVCRALHVSSLQSFRMDIAGLSAMHERVRIAKDIVKRTAKEAQSGQEESWLQELSRDTGLDLDDYLLNEGGPAGDRLEEQRGRKKGLDKERAKIRALLQSAPDPRSRNGSQAAGPQRRKGSFIVVAK